ncbi:5-oxoprolinase subunit PxpB [Bacillus kexueae]|uniref:5-oxoprolinase subunit PxpB n=1 Tax=Aeribacillus kexueae TaxID=2078952 RepID=UPI001FAEE65A|nr:5-oxoprolinase subunit PxpB [Bacillus kexueae]
MNFKLVPLSESSLTIKLGDQVDEQVHNRVRTVTTYLSENPLKGIVEIVPAFTSVTIYFDPMSFYHEKSLPYENVCEQLIQMLQSITTSEIKDGKEIVIPVCYGEEFGPDIEDVARHNKLTVEDVISIHTSGIYRVYMLGFAPGFAYLGGMSEQIATPRKQSPRLKIPARSVGIAGVQTGIYPIESPGGWQLIGKTPIELFRPKHSQPSLLQMGDKVRFRAITKEEFNQIEEEHHGYTCSS